MLPIVASIGGLMSHWEAAFDHTGINFGSGTRKFKRAPRGVHDVYNARSINSKLSITYVLCASRKHGMLPGYYIISEKIASAKMMTDLQNKGIIPRHIR